MSSEALRVSYIGRRDQPSRKPCRIAGRTTDFDSHESRYKEGIKACWRVSMTGLAVAKSFLETYGVRNHGLWFVGWDYIRYKGAFASGVACLALQPITVGHGRSSSNFILKFPSSDMVIFYINTWYLSKFSSVDGALVPCSCGKLCLEVQVNLLDGAMVRVTWCALVNLTCGDIQSSIR